MSNLRTVMIPQNKEGYDKGDFVKGIINDEIVLSKYYLRLNPYWQAQYLYVIDEDAEIKCEDACIDLRRNEIYIADWFNENNQNHDDYLIEKIIATNDPSLISKVPSLSEQFIKDYVRLQGKGVVEYEYHWVDSKHKGNPVLRFIEEENYCSPNNRNNPRSHRG